MLPSPIFSFLFALALFFSPSLEGRGKIEKKDPLVYFSPKDKLAKKLITLIDREEKSVHVAIYCLKNRAIANALVRAQQRGVEVEVLVDPFSAKGNSPLPKLTKAGIPVFVWNPSLEDRRGPFPDPGKRPSLMHHKFCVFGSGVVWTGSFNFTTGADAINCENAVVFANSEMAKSFEAHFCEMKSEGASPYEEYLKSLPKKSLRNSKKL